VPVKKFIFSIARQWKKIYKLRFLILRWIKLKNISAFLYIFVQFLPEE